MRVLIRAPAGRRLELEATPSDTFGQLKRRLLPHMGVDAWLEHRGRSWGNQVTLDAAGVTAATPIDMHLRIRGGGGDGGSTGAESRSSYLEMYACKKADKVNPAEVKLSRWTRCQLSGERLQPPVVADELGSLFNKDAVIQAMIARSLPKALSHITSLKHLIDLKLEPNSAAGQSVATQGTFQLGNVAAFMCPVTGLEMNGRFRFLLCRKTGHVLSERALKQAAPAVEELVGCSFSMQDTMPINGTDEEVQDLREGMFAKRAAAKAKKAKGSAKAAVLAHVVADTPAEQSSTVLEKLAAAAPLTLQAAGSKRAAAAALDTTVQVKAQKLATPRLPPGATKDVWSSIFLTGRKGAPDVGANDFLCRSTSARGMNML